MALFFSAILFAMQTLRWEDAERHVNWGVVALYGGAIAIGSALHSTGATRWLIDTIMPGTEINAWVALGPPASPPPRRWKWSATRSHRRHDARPAPDCRDCIVDPRVFAWSAPISAGLAFMLPTSTPALAMVFAPDTSASDTRCPASSPSSLSSSSSLPPVMVALRPAGEPMNAPRLLLAVSTSRYSEHLVEVAMAEAKRLSADGAAIDVLHILEEEDLAHPAPVGDQGFLGLSTMADLMSTLGQEHHRMALLRIDEVKQAARENGFEVSVEEAKGRFVECVLEHAGRTHETILTMRADRPS